MRIANLEIKIKIEDLAEFSIARHSLKVLLFDSTINIQKAYLQIFSTTSITNGHIICDSIQYGH